MDKQEIIKEIQGQIDTGRSAIGISYILYSGYWKTEMLKQNSAARIEIQSEKNLHVFEITEPRQIALRYEDEKVAQSDSLNLFRLNISHMLTQIFELIKNYSKVTNQYTKFQELSWFNFIRHVRNAFGHNYILHGISSKEKPIFIQLKDRKLELNESMNGLELDFDILPLQYCYEITEIMLNSFDKNLN